MCTVCARVTAAEVNESKATVTEECVIMIPASPWACVCGGSTYTLNFTAFLFSFCHADTLEISLFFALKLCKNYKRHFEENNAFMFSAST